MAIPTLADIDAQLEDELKWRQDEIRFFKNIKSQIKPTNWERYNRAIVALLYAHYEGFCKVGFLAFISSINKAGFRTDELNDHLAAASFHDVFKCYEMPMKPNLYFSNKLPDDLKTSQILSASRIYR